MWSLQAIQVYQHMQDFKFFYVAQHVPKSWQHLFLRPNSHWPSIDHDLIKVFQYLLCISLLWRSRKTPEALHGYCLIKTFSCWNMGWQKCRVQASLHCHVDESLSPCINLEMWPNVGLFKKPWPGSKPLTTPMASERDLCLESWLWSTPSWPLAGNPTQISEF